MLKLLFRIGLLCRLSRAALRKLVCLLSVLAGPVRIGLGYVWKNRRQTLSLLKKFLEAVKLVSDVIRNITSLLFCNQTATFVRVAG